jgi:transporter family-2 protein
MTQTLYVVAALLVGMGSSVQVAFISQMGKLKGASEATWINTMGALIGICLGIIVDTMRKDTPDFPAPFNNVFTFAGILVIAAICLVISVRGLTPYLAISGLFGFIYVFGAGFLAPKIGVALFSTTVTAGTLTGAVILDNFGAFGIDIHRATLMRVGGLLVMFLGVVMVRSGR